MLPIEIVQHILLRLPASTCWIVARSLGLRMNFCLRYCLPRIPAFSSMDAASKHDRVFVLDCWKTSGLKLEYTEVAMDAASDRNHIQVLDWWKASGLPLKYT